jgi:hypothetical protein
MADKKISALTASSTPLAGTEVLPIVQSGATVKVSVANLTAGRAISATELTLTTGNLIVSNGNGIDFSATPGTGTSELLADYEEGTWTPTDNSGAGLSFTSVSATYTKVGRLVNCLCQLIYPTTASTASANIAGLPFTSANTQANRSGGVMTISTTAAVQRIFPAINDTTFPLLSGTSSGVTNAACSGAQFNFCITYYT